MRRRNQLKVFILITVFLCLLLAATGGAYYFLTKETAQLNNDLEVLKAENAALIDKANQLQISVEEKNIALNSTDEA